jgi:hypothetical protein
MVWGITHPSSALWDGAELETKEVFFMHVFGMFEQMILQNMLDEIILVDLDTQKRFVSPSNWPASCPDLNPLDYFAWEHTFSKHGFTKHMTLAKFKTHLT